MRRSETPTTRSLEAEMAKYRNSFFKGGYQIEYGPEIYETDAKPADYRGHQIFRRLPSCFDIVRDGSCISQCAGLNGAIRRIDTLLAQEAS